MSSLAVFDALLRVRLRAPSIRFQRAAHQDGPRSPACPQPHLLGQQVEPMPQSEWIDPIWCRSSSATFIAGESV